MHTTWQRVVAGAVCTGVLSLLLGGCPPTEPPAEALKKIASPPTGRLYHGVFPGSLTGAEDDISAEDITAYEQAVGQGVAWVYFAHNWYQSRAFPLNSATMIRDRGAVPFIRLMLRSSDVQNQAEPVFNLPAIIAGEFDADLDAWGAAARDFGDALLVEWGTECNGQWFSWNGVWNGGEEPGDFGDPGVPDGPERFVAAFRHIVERIRGAGAANVTFVWHVNADDVPGEAWNALENYYPGDDVVDWLAVSVYGPSTPLTDDAPIFTTVMDSVYPRLAALSADRPIIVAEFGCAANHPAVAADEWADDALTQLLGRRWPRIIGFSWWNERWPNDENPAHDTIMRVQEVPALAATFRRILAANEEQLGAPVIVDVGP